MSLFLQLVSGYNLIASMVIIVIFIINCIFMITIIISANGFNLLASLMISAQSSSLVLATFVFLNCTELPVAQYWDIFRWIWQLALLRGRVSVCIFANHQPSQGGIWTRLPPAFVFVYWYMCKCMFVYLRKWVSVFVHGMATAGCFEGIWAPLPSTASLSLCEHMCVLSPLLFHRPMSLPTYAEVKCSIRN